MGEIRRLIRINGNDNVAVALCPLHKGEALPFPAGSLLTAADDIPAGHKIALKDIEAGERIIKYGFPIGAATVRINRGAHVHTHNVRTLLSETPEYQYKAIDQRERESGDSSREAADSPGSPDAGDIPEISVFRRKDGRIGIRNEIWIIPTVGCVNKTAEILARWADREYGGGAIDGVYAWTHPYGCSQMGRDHETTKTILADLAKHPNAAAVLILSLGCENNSMKDFKEALGEYGEDTERMAFLVTQDCGDEIAEGKTLLAALAFHAALARREPAKLPEIIVGLKCGGSDGFSGITANALTGRLCDTLCAMGASAILTEVPEMFGAEQMLMDRCETRELFDKTVSLITNFKEYYRSHNQTVYENPSPGNKAGGITTLEDKSCGCVQKGGAAPIRGVYCYGERIVPGKGGVLLLEGPGNDIVSSTAMTAAGAHLILFTTGRGTPLGAPVPTVKIASNSALARKKANWIDFDAEAVLDNGMEPLCADLLDLIIAVASGRKKTKNELNGYREIAIFKNGVTL
ncbi:MAG: altronate dehydratase family protein [Spirochaetaceae bacterium]|jgi:altronate hydrolase|nr:altronate dehydratase family protein [Spirochaetaceae bacterium]